MRQAVDLIPAPLLWSMAAAGLFLVLTVLAVGFVWFAMDTD